VKLTKWGINMALINPSIVLSQTSQTGMGADGFALSLGPPAS
jgi:hypothetical protein